jgi:hypothetical protein
MNVCRLPSLLGGCCVLVALLLTQGASPARVDAPQKPGGQAAEKVVLRVFRLGHAPASAVARVVRELLGDAAGAKGGLRITVHEGTNSLLMLGSPARLAEVEAILTKVDVEGQSNKASEPQLRIVSLANFDPDRGLEDTLRMLFAGRGQFVVDRRRRLLIMRGDPKTLQSVGNMINLLTPQCDERGGPPTELQVRLFWIVDGPARKGAAGLPRELEGLAADLARQGIARPRLATQLSVSTVTGNRFESSGTVKVNDPHELSVSGTARLEGPEVVLQLMVGVDHAGARQTTRRVASLRTQLTVSPGRPTVIGVTPTEKLTSAFVVLVTPRAPTGKKGAFEFREAPWSRVFAWLSERTGLPIISIIKPAGTFTFIPDRIVKSYTTTEVLDVLNRSLLRQQLNLLRRERSLVMVTLDEKSDKLPRIHRPEDLVNHGKTEVVNVVVPLHGVKAEEIAPEVQKLLGPDSDVTALTGTNQLIMQDTTDNLRRICKMLEQLQGRKAR